MPDRDDNAETFRLIMPFKATASEGGPFDDRSFAAGFQVGQIDAALLVTDRTDVGPLTAYAALAEQLDLVAMRHRFTMETGTFDDDDDWLVYRFHRQAAL